MPGTLKDQLEPFGLPAEGWLDLTVEPTPRTIRYLDLHRRSAGEIERGLPDAIVEMQQEPVACVVDGSRERSVDLPTLRRNIAMRGDIPYLVISEPGRITVYRVDLGRADLLGDQTFALHAEDRAASSAFYRLHLDPREEKGRRFVHDVLFELLTDAIDGLMEAGLERDDAISLAGRALFLRFLVDRGILKPADSNSVCPGTGSVEELFRSARVARITCRWLDRTFNGDFLPLGASDEDFFSGIREDGFQHLSNILGKSLAGQRRFDWGDLDFAHIPVGVLSQVYERQAERWDAAGQRAQSVYYTPWRIAEYMVREVFAGLRERGPVAPHQARLLDPSVGGGVFLVAALQEIVAAWWEHRGVAPDTKQIRSILHRQLAGFDISEPALRLAALGLYLKAIELDPDPQPVEKLGFEPLRGTVLHNVRGDSDRAGARYVVGSLGAEVGKEHCGAYDVVVGNPPWTSLAKKEGKKVHVQMVETVRPLVAERLGTERASEFTIPDLVPDLPFVWRASEWARPGGWIAFAVHARLLFKTSRAGEVARRDLFEALTVTGVLNGTDLRNTEVWPHVAAPFALLFAVNEAPPRDHSFYFVSPYLEESLNRQGRVRIDASAAQPVALSRLLEVPTLLKSLFRGPGLDTTLLEKLQARRWPTVEEYWASHGLYSSQGYRVADRSKDAAFLRGKPNLTTSTDFRFIVDTKALPKFDDLKLHRPGKERLYRGPLLLVRESPPFDRQQGRGLVSCDDIVFNESFYGFSARGHDDGSLLVRYLLLIIHSQVFLWYLLMTSGKFGVEREAIQKDDVETLPVAPLESLSQQSRDRIIPIFESLVAEDPFAFTKLDQWVAEIYGLDPWDQETIRDTLEVHSPFPASRRRAQATPTNEEIEDFVERLHEGLTPFFDELRKPRLLPAEGSPWQPILLEVGEPETSESSVNDLELRSIYRSADEQGASRVIAPLPTGRLLIAVLRQYRYWTPTRARLCAIEILDEHLGHLVGEK